LAGAAAGAGLATDRAALPAEDLADLLAAHAIPPFTLGCRPLRGVPLWLVWLDALHDLGGVVQLLRLSGLAPCSRHRSEQDPVIVAAGPGAVFTALVQEVADLALPGDPEVAVTALLRELPGVVRARTQVNDDAFLREVRRVVQGRRDRPVDSTLPLVSTLPDHPQEGVAPLAEAGPDALLIETGRGCALGDRTCGLRGAHVCPPRHRATADLATDTLNAVLTSGWERVWLVTGAGYEPGDLDESLLALERLFLGRGVSLGLPGAWPAIATERALAAIARTGTRQLVLPELLVGGTSAEAATASTLLVQRDADVIVSEAARAGAAGIRTIRLPLVVGVPDETEADHMAAARLVRYIQAIARRAPHGLRLIVDLVPLAYEPHGPWLAQEWPAAVDLSESLTTLSGRIALRAVRVNGGSVESAAFESRLRREGPAALALLLHQGGAEECGRDYSHAIFHNGGSFSRNLQPHLQTVTQNVMRDRVAENVAVSPPLALAPQYGRRKRRSAGELSSTLRYRVQYTKGPEVRFASHLEVTRMLDRTLRRAAVPVAYSKGHSPRPRLAFGPPAAVGMTSRAEYFDIELREPFRGDLLGTLQRHLPCGFDAVAAVPLCGAVPSLAAAIDVAEYMVAPPTHAPSAREGNVSLPTHARRAEIAASFMKSDSWILSRRAGEDPVNVRPAVLRLAAAADGFRITLRLTHAAAVRPEVLVASLLQHEWPVDPRTYAVEREALLIALPGRCVTPLEAAVTARGTDRMLGVEGWGTWDAT
jgi:radical SAM-linked protein